MSLTPPSITTIAATGAPTTTPDADVNAAALKANFELAVQRQLAPSDPAAILLDLVAYAYTLAQWSSIEAARQTLLEYASGINLDHLAQPFGVTRLPASKARVTIAFSVDGTLTTPRFLATGTRLRAPNYRLTFDLIESGTLPAGVVNPAIVLIAECTIAGKQGNIPANEITQFLSPLPDVTLTNLGAASGGTEVESDDALRIRIPQAIEAAAPGSAEGYAAIAFEVDAIVVDVAVYGPIERIAENRDALDGHAELFILTEAGLPTEELLAKIQAKILGDERGRIIGDYVQAIAPEDVPFLVSCNLYRDPAFNADVVQREVSSALQAELDRRAATLGASIHRSQLEAIALSIDGVIAVECEMVIDGSPDDSIVATRSQWLHATALDVVIAGDGLP
jgi:phage-related baseplate assembly protein